MTIVKEGSVSTDLQTNPVPFFSVDSIVRALRQSIVAELDAINMYQKMADSILQKSSKKDSRSLAELYKLLLKQIHNIITSLLNQTVKIN